MNFEKDYLIERGENWICVSCEPEITGAEGYIYNIRDNFIPSFKLSANKKNVRIALPDKSWPDKKVYSQPIPIEAIKDVLDGLISVGDMPTINQHDENCAGIDEQDEPKPVPDERKITSSQLSIDDLPRYLEEIGREYASLLSDIKVALKGLQIKDLFHVPKDLFHLAEHIRNHPDAVFEKRHVPAYKVKERKEREDCS